MSTLAEEIREHHRALAESLEAHSRAVGGDQSLAECDSLLTFLRRDLLPHARAEEIHFYGVVDELAGRYGKATATMRVDHEFIADYVARIERIRSRIATASNVDRPPLLGQLRELAVRLDAILELHLAKEERVYLPLVDQHLDQARQGQLLKAIQESYAEERKMQEVSLLDVRNVVPRSRHALIFDTFAGLAPGQAFVLINDHDPRPLYYQFQAEHPAEFSWEYLEQGPEDWRVRIRRCA
jgi:uncharacterized protein (DUF2249 family)/hemerythrin-like domain-containing protein